MASGVLLGVALLRDPDAAGRGVRAIALGVGVGVALLPALAVVAVTAALAVGVVTAVGGGSVGGADVRVGVGGVALPVGAVVVRSGVGVLGRGLFVAGVRVVRGVLRLGRGVGLVAVVLAGVAVRVVARVPVHAVLAGVVGQGLRFVDRLCGRGGRGLVVPGAGDLQVRDLQRGFLHGRALAAAPAPAALPRAAAYGPAGGEAAPEGQRHEGLAGGEGERPDDDDRYGGQQHSDHHAEEAGEGEEPPAQSCLVLQQHLAEQPQGHQTESDVEDRPAHARPLLRP